MLLWKTMKQLLFLPTWSHQNSETLSKYSYFQGNIIICSSPRICFCRFLCPCNRTQLETCLYCQGFDLNVIFYNDVHGLRYDQTPLRNKGWPYGSNRTLWNKSPDAFFFFFQSFYPYQLSEEIHFLANPRTESYLGDLKKRKIHPNP